MITIASYQCTLPIRSERDMTGPDFESPSSNLAGRGQLVACDRKDGHGAFAAICHQRQSAGIVDRHASRAQTGLKRRNDRRRFGLEVDYRELVVRNGLFRVSRIYFEGTGHQRKAFIARYRYALRGPTTLAGALTSPMRFGGETPRSMMLTVSAAGLAGTTFAPSTSTALLSFAETQNLGRSPYAEQREYGQREAKLRRPPTGRSHKASPARIILL